ncbi:succinate dehydrogenase/fumarate reductase iron-sulfur subunit [Ammoniphilus sp. CFH 90114]|uniref:succinate dehydrogenase/fumarate reductase iron-sulfur subunit n=1 Tax=Ammoniphilus sp. CFH 90114 TaxID=2493665 RepID=UPI00100DA3F9|nr:succinate dehydrogenase/fumarate reductase iron-sulfur subunit [Ammoniphilus sp. CFH 90114]RXT07255.1 succinate dehydrogenase/fumarate reductase iron-sulfur subunit [Ammoniphilus sp. CFH 90114]
MRKITFTIKRFDGNKDWLQRYDLPYENGKTLLWALTKIREEQDPTLNFTSACRHAICGSCAIRVNGNSFLTCKTALDEILDTFKTDDLKCEPLGNFDVVRDLVIDWKPKLEKMKVVKPWIIPKESGSPTTGFKQSEQEFQKIASPTDCILCGICASECTQLAMNQEGYLEPFILNRAYRFAVDSRDGAPEEHIRPVLENDLWKCVHCMQCVSQCPKDINLSAEVAYLRQETMKMGETQNLGARHAYAFHDDVKNKGRLNEMTLPMKTEGVVKTAMKRVPFALRMISKGKINPLHMPKEVEGIAGVRKIYEYAKGVDQP